MENWSDRLRDALRMLSKNCPRLVASCYWAGTSAISLEELNHRQSFDLDFHTSKALQDVRPLLAEMQSTLGDSFELISSPDEFGSGFRGLLRLPSGEKVTIEVLSNYENVGREDVTASTLEPALKRIVLRRYLMDKLQCLAERAEARDLVDVQAVLQSHPELLDIARQRVESLDALTIAERLLAWTDDAIRKDLLAYEDVDPAAAMEMRGTLLAWLKEGHNR